MPNLRSKSLSGIEWSAVALRIGIGLIGLFLLAIVIGVFSSGGHSRPAANRIRCSSNLRQIGLAIKMYANSNAGAYPPSLGALLVSEEITTDVFICPSTNADDRAEGRTKAEQAQQVDDPMAHYCSYLYAGNGLNDEKADADDVLAFERLTNHDEDGINVLYADGHVDWMAVAQDGPERAKFDRFMADFAAGKRPLRDGSIAATQPAR